MATPALDQPPDRQRERRQMAWAAAAVIFGGAPHMFTIVPWVPFLVLGISAWRIAAAARGWRLPSLWLRLPITVFGFLGVAVSYRSISGVDAGSALLLVMAALKLLETRTERDRVLVVFIGYFLLFAVFLREQAIWSLAWLAAGGVGITAALAQTVRRERLLTLPAAAGLAGRMVLQALPLAVLLFILFPRIPGPFWAMSTSEIAGMSGLAEEIQPGDISRLSLSDEVAFRVRFQGEAPSAGLLYWRGPVLEQFDGHTWSAILNRKRLSVAPEIERQGPEFDYQVVLEPQGKRWLLALETPVRWSLPRASLSPSLQLLSAEPTWERLTYRARSVATGLGAVAASAETLAANLELPGGRNPRTRALATEVRSQSADDRDYLARLLQIFRTEKFSYTLTPPALGFHSVDDFLFDTREGFCEHYASALAVLARAGGLPARVVVGYQGGERNPFADYWIVRQANAHAWVEVWMDGGWRRVDPTAAVAPDRIERGIEQSMAGVPRIGARLWRTNFVLNRLVLSWDAVNAGWDRWVLAFGPEIQDDLLLALGFEVPKPIQLAGLAGIGTVACLIIMGIALRHRNWRRRDPGARLYGELCRRLAVVVRSRTPAETALHYAEAVASARPDLAADVRTMTDLYLRLRYGGATDPGLERRLADMISRFRPRAAPAPA